MRFSWDGFLSRPHALEAYFYLGSSFSERVGGSGSVRTRFLAHATPRQAAAFFLKCLFLLVSHLLFLKIHMLFIDMGAIFQLGSPKIV